MQAPFVVALTGAGISADSGLQTFRDADGLWEGQRPEDVATPAAWARDPACVWRFYQARRRALLGVEPNAAHRALARFGAALAEAGGELFLLTQNVDDLHERAGSEAWHMHGELLRLRCTSCTYAARDTEQLDDELVECARCGRGRLRPDVVWFGELPYFLDEIEQAMQRCRLFLSLGTSGVVYPAAGLLAAARARGVRTVVNSLDPPENLAAQDEFHPGRAVDVLPGLLQDLEQELCGGGRKE